MKKKCSPSWAHPALAHPALALVSGLILTHAAPNARGQTAPADAASPAPASAPTTLPEVKATAVSGTTTTEGSGQYTARVISIGKTEQSLRETPQSVSVITRQLLDDRNFTKLEDAIKQTTGINVTRFDGAGNYNTIQSRGFDIAAIQLDGVPMPQGANYATAFDTAIYDHIEVLRGPGGLVNGGGEPGGVINLARKRALGQLGVGASLSAGSFDFRRADVDVTGALNASGTLRGRVVALTDRRESHVDVLFNDKKLGYGTLEFDVTPATTLSVGYTKQEVRSVVDQGLPSYADGSLIDLPRNTFAGLRANRQDLEMSDRFLEVEHRLDNGGQIKFSARDVDRFSYYRAARANSAAAANGAIQLQTVDNQIENTDRNVDLFISSPFTLGERTHRVLLGVSRYVGDAYTGAFAFGPNLAFNIFQPDYDLPYPAITLPGYTALTKRRESALYGQVQIAATERLKLLLGGRMSWAEIDAQRLSDGVVTSTSKPGRQVTPSLAAIYELNQHLSAYTSYAESFVVQTALNAAGGLLVPRTGSQIEAGLKGEFLGKRLQTHAAVFRIDDENRAIADPDVPTASVAGGKVRSQGFELEASGQLAPGWDVLAGYAYTDTEYLQAPVSQQGQAFSTVTPRHSVNLSSRYAFRNGVLNGWSVGAGASYRSQFFAQSGAVQLVSGDYTLFNAQLGYQINDQLSLNLSADNLLDKTYYEKVSSQGRQNYYGEPRRVALTLRAQY